jgi:hypothetical protein
MNSSSKQTKNRGVRSPKTAAKKPRNVVARIERMEHPPQIDGYEVTHSKRMRFLVTAAATTTFTFQNLLDTVLLATTAVAGFDLFDIVKINFIEVWSQAALGTPTTISITFVTNTGDRSVQTDTSLGVKPAFVHAKPSKKSLASFFQLSGGGAAFVISAPAGSVIDVDLSFKTAQATPVAAQNALVGATVGEMYFRGLDGLAAAGTNYPVAPGGVPVI